MIFQPRKFSFESEKTALNLESVRQISVRQTAGSKVLIYLSLLLFLLPCLLIAVHEQRQVNQNFLVRKYLFALLKGRKPFLLFLSSRIISQNSIEFVFVLRSFEENESDEMP